jgi:hypothetical protein
VRKKIGRVIDFVGIGEPMKTNHRRNFKDTIDRSRNAFESKLYATRPTVHLKLSDRIVARTAALVVTTRGKVGLAHSKAGAKKFVRSRARFHENAATKKLASELD